MANALELRGVSFAYGRYTALSNVSFDVAKSTLFAMIGGQLAPTAGTISLFGRPLAGLAPDTIWRLGLGRTFQRSTLFADISVADNLRIAAAPSVHAQWNALAPIRGIATIGERVDAELRRLRLAESADTVAGSLAYGDQKLVEIAMALVARPRVLLLDEPTAGLSQGETRGIIDVVAGLGRAYSVVMIEHDMEVVFRIADRIVVLHHGEVMAIGTPDEVRANALVREIYLGGHADAHG
jgi:branched-chain amino acid transport system ATP-binding protein